MGAAMPRPQFDLDPREVLAFVRPLSEREQLVYLLACRGLCAGIRGDPAIGRRIGALTEKFRRQLPAILADARQLGDWARGDGRGAVGRISRPLSRAASRLPF